MAVIVGLIVAGIGFYIYQTTKAIPPTKLGTVKISPPTPTPPAVILAVTSPIDESITANKTITISGKTNPTATILISTPTADQVIKPSSQGDFSTTATIGDGANLIRIIAIGPSGNQSEKDITITYSTENF